MEMIEVLKKFLAGVFLLMMISAQASAMRLELYPQPIGKIFSYNYNDFKIDGATQIKGDLKKGVVRFGEDFYLHFDCETIYNRFGDRDKKNSVNVDTYGETEIYRIKNTAGHDLYLLKKLNADDDRIKILGLRGGNWIEQLNALDFRAKHNIGKNFSLTKFFTEDNKIIFRYTLQNRFIDVVCHYHAVNEKFYTEAIEQ
ncbi:MAG: hypothetical protein IJL12_02015 [Selenomonadaceae bacterium]|nr:hypothetical protein [Selenomonadaceae bacterium]